jgi:L-ascorbate metabolism protein UlaG (beta-lactamase superfamily)
MESKNAKIALLVVLALLAVLAIAFYTSTGGQKVPSVSAEYIDNRIELYPPSNLSSDRIAMLGDVNDFIQQEYMDVGDPFFQNSELYSFIKIREDKLAKDISEASVEPGKMRIWYVYNMGVIAKTNQSTVAFDLAGTYVYPGIADLVKYVDVLVISHPHGDHMDRNVIKKAVENKVPIVVPDARIKIVNYLFQNYPVKDPNGKTIPEMFAESYSTGADDFITVKNGQTVNVKGIYITGFEAEHRTPEQPTAEYPFDAPVDWFYVNMSGFGLLHTGDGYLFGDKPNFSSMPVDVFIVNFGSDVNNEDRYKTAPNARIMLPLHLYELGHGKDIFDYATFRQALETQENGYLKLRHLEPPVAPVKFVPLIWGESIEIQNITLFSND